VRDYIDELSHSYKDEASLSHVHSQENSYEDETPNETSSPHKHYRVYEYDHENSDHQGKN
jgi:hypothetical protein